MDWTRLKPSGIRRVALLGNHMPRQCGIATFTTDLGEAISRRLPGVDCFVTAMSDSGRQYAYPDAVRIEIVDDQIQDYVRAAATLNSSGADVLCLQHEYGIFGGPAGGHVLSLLRRLRMPIVTTLHTILEEPGADRRSVMEDILDLSERVVVMSAHGADLLRRVHRVPANKIDHIAHGIPDFPPVRSSRTLLGVERKSVILTFGLLSADKGIEHVIDAMPSILARFPDTVYLVVGATHPHVLAKEGERYRQMLEERSRRLGIERSVIFHNRFVSREELTQFLAAADIYITPYLKPEQITSGTLAYAIGCGKAVISTPYWYATELLADGRGVLVPWRDSAAIAREATALLADDDGRHLLGTRAARFGSDMGWPVVAQRYMECFEKAVARIGSRAVVLKAPVVPLRSAELPEPNLSHLRLMTDDTGVLQHATFSVPRYSEGYCLDDNARALLVVTQAEEGGGVDDQLTADLAYRYLSFISYALDPGTGRFRNFMSYARSWTEDVGSEDSHGRAVWALAAYTRRSVDSGARGLLADSLLRAALERTTGFSSPRAWSYVLLGLSELSASPQQGPGVDQYLEPLARRLLDLHRRTFEPGFPWFEDRLTYCNARLPQALIASGRLLDNDEMKERGLRSLAFLVSEQRSSTGHFAPIGSNGFYVRGGPKAAHDQQPVEACGMVGACLEAQLTTGDPVWFARARWAFDWFMGDNQLGIPLYDSKTGGTRDGLHEDRANENQGAESSLSFLAALFDMRAASMTQPARLIRRRGAHPGNLGRDRVAQPALS